MARKGPAVARARGRVAAPRAACWRALTEPAVLARWWAERLEGSFSPGRDVTLAWDSLGQSIALRVLEVKPPAVLRLRGAPPGRPPQQQLVTLAERGGETEIEIVHSGFRGGVGGEDERAGTEAGWRAALSLLQLYMECYEGEPRAAAAALSATAASPATAHGGLARCFGLTSAPAAGDEARIDLGARAHRARVLLAAPPHHILASLPEMGAALALRTFPAGPVDAPGGSVVAAQLWRWGADDGRQNALQAALAAELERAVSALGGGFAGA